MPQNIKEISDITQILDNKLNQVSAAKFKKENAVPETTAEDDLKAKEAIENAKMEVKLMNYRLDRMLPQDQARNKDDPMHQHIFATSNNEPEWAMLDLFNEQSTFLYRINIANRLFPLKFSFRFNPEKEIPSDVPLPEDMVICLSQNVKEPSVDNFQQKLGTKTLKAMNYFKKTDF